MFSELFQRRPLRVLLCLGFFLRALTALANPGFISFDDYQSVLRLLIPWQRIESLSWIVQASEIRSPLVRLALVPFPWLAYHLGLSDPFWQIRLLYLGVGSISCVLIWLAYKLFQHLGREDEARLAGFLVAVHFLLPYVNTRVMFENLCMAPFFASLYCLHRYVQKPYDIKAIHASVIFMAIASVARPQVGICWIVIAGYVVASRSLKHVAHLFISSALCFLLIGFSDQWLRGTFHQTLRLYWDYNVHHSAEYGSYPVTYYLPVVIALTFLPFLFASWKSISVKKLFRHLHPTLWFFVVFFVSHSLIKHKEERFLYPAIPLLIVLLTPWIDALIKQGKTLRLKLGLALNSLLLFGIALFPAQWNVAGMVKYLDEHPQLTKVHRYKDSGALYPTIYSARVLPDMIEVGTIDADLIASMKDCQSVLMLREDYWPEVAPDSVAQLKVQATFAPGPLEALVVKLNPGKNRRRAAIVALMPQSCSEAHSGD